MPCLLKPAITTNLAYFNQQLFSTCANLIASTRYYVTIQNVPILSKGQFEWLVEWDGTNGPGSFTFDPYDNGGGAGLTAWSIYYVGAPWIMNWLRVTSREVNHLLTPTVYVFLSGQVTETAPTIPTIGIPLPSIPTIPTINPTAPTIPPIPNLQGAIHAPPLPTGVLNGLIPGELVFLECDAAGGWGCLYNPTTGGTLHSCPELNICYTAPGCPGGTLNYLCQNNQFIAPEIPVIPNVYYRESDNSLFFANFGNHFVSDFSVAMSTGALVSPRFFGGYVSNNTLREKEIKMLYTIIPNASLFSFSPLNALSDVQAGNYMYIRMSDTTIIRPDNVIASIATLQFV